MKDDVRYYITLVMISLLFLYLVTALWWIDDRSSVNGKCSITDINYVDVSPSECWIGNVNETFCPLPTNIDCSGEIQGIAKLFVEILKSSID